MEQGCNLRCRAKFMTTDEFNSLGFEVWDHGFKIKMGKRARRLYMDLYKGKAPRKVRSSTHPLWRNKVGKFPCGILEEAYKQLRGEGVRTVRDPSQPSAAPKRVRRRSEISVLLDDLGQKT